MFETQSMRKIGMLALAGLLAGALGCRQELPVNFESNLVHAHKYEMTQGVPMDQVVEDTDWALERLFGTPDHPKLPELSDPEATELVQSVVSLERLESVAGPVQIEGDQVLAGAYRQHCATCHGDTGNGRGPAGAALNPYPRDYRMGIFKFKSTTRDAKPTKEDLARVIRHGIPGSGMVPIPGITEEEIQSLVDYVIYLSWRGQVERQIMDAAIFDLDLAAGQRVIRPEFADLADTEIDPLSEEEEALVDALEEKLETALLDALTPQVQEANPEADEEELAELVEEELDYLPVAEREALTEQVLVDLASQAELDAWKHHQQLERKEMFEENWSYIEESVISVAESWLEAEEEVTELVEAGEIPVPQDRAEFAAMMKGPEAAALTASVERGRELFLSEAVGCSKCHGKAGRGDGQTEDYDDWTKDWTVNVGLDPKNTDKLVPLMARGALKPQNIKPRNFAEGVFRGGSAPQHLFRRIANGIAGTPMPAASEIEGTFEKRDIWHLINFVRSLEELKPSEGADQLADAAPAA
jgi:mono/diheme cytochrome c family protein